MDQFDVKIGGPAKKLQSNLKYWGIYNLNKVLISRVLKILASQNRFQSLYDEIFNIDRFVDLSSNLFLSGLMYSNSISFTHTHFTKYTLNASLKSNCMLLLKIWLYIFCKKFGIKKALIQTR